MSVPAGKRLFVIAKDDRVRYLIIGPESFDIEDAADRYSDGEEGFDPYVADLDEFVKFLITYNGFDLVPFAEFDSDYHTLIT